MIFSIITINYNNRKGLKKTIDSVISQTFTDYEWIIIDGGSTDGSKELIEKYQDHFSYWCSEPDKGVFNAMNKGIRIAQGDYLNFMNSGDLYASTTVLEDVSCKISKADVYYGDYLRVFDTYVQLIKVEYSEFPGLFWHKNICHQAMFFKRTCLEKEGYDESYKILADWARNIKLSLEGASFEYLPLTICKYDMSGLSSQNNDNKMVESKRIHSMYPLWMLNDLKIVHRIRNNKDILNAIELIDSSSVYRYPIKALVRLIHKIKF